MKNGLFEGIRGCFLSGEELEKVDPSRWLTQSIIDHLNLLFNERCASEAMGGSVPQNPDYGLPDLSDIYIEPSKAKRVERLRAKIEESLVRFEPRLTNIKVEAGDNPPTDYRLTFYLKADVVQSETVQFQTVFALAEPTMVIERKAKRE